MSGSGDSLRKVLRASGAAVVVTLAVASCGNGTNATATLASGSACTAGSGQADNGQHDNPALRPGGHGITSNSTWPAGSAEQVAGASDAVAVLRLVSRAAPIATGDAGPEQGARASQAHQPPADGQFNVVRPATFETVRILKGQLPDCLHLDVPGGQTSDYAVDTDAFPARLVPGDEVLALLSTTGSSSTSSPSASAMFLADQSGWVTLPFADNARVNVNTWTLTPQAQPSQSQPGEAPPPAPASSDRPAAPPPSSTPPGKG